MGKRKRTRPVFAALGLGCFVALIHLLVEGGTWATWDAAPAPGKPYPHPMPAMWPVISFPLWPLYEALTGDRGMAYTFWWVMVGNSVVWGGAACGAVLALMRPRQGLPGVEA